MTIEYQLVDEKDFSNAFLFLHPEKAAALAECAWAYEQTENWSPEDIVRREGSSIVVKETGIIYPKSVVDEWDYIPRIEDNEAKFLWESTFNCPSIGDERDGRIYPITDDYPHDGIMATLLHDEWTMPDYLFYWSDRRLLRSSFIDRLEDDLMTGYFFAHLMVECTYPDRQILVERFDKKGRTWFELTCNRSDRGDVQDLDPDHGVQYDLSELKDVVMEKTKWILEAS